MICKHRTITGETASGDDIDLCPTCEKRRVWSEEDRRDYFDELAALRAEREDMSGIRDGADGW